MATKRKNIEDTVLGGEKYEWKLVKKGTSLDIRECENCGFTSDFPKNMNNCIWDKCPKCHKKMYWNEEE